MDYCTCIIVLSPRAWQEISCYLFESTCPGGSLNHRILMSHFTQNKWCTWTDKYQLTALQQLLFIAFYDFIYNMNICWLIIYLFFWCLYSNMTNMNKFRFIILLTYIQLINWIEDLVLELFKRVLIKGCVCIFNPIITIFTVVFPSKECFLFTKKW